MAIDKQHVALPKLFGAPAYARPMTPVEVTPRPPDADDLPIEALRTDEEQEVADALPAYPNISGVSPASTRRPIQKASGDQRPKLRARPLSLKAMAGRLRRGDS